MTPLNAREANSSAGGPSFSFKNRLFRALWNVIWLLLAAWTPPPLHGWRRFLLRLFGAKLASTAKVYGSARVWYPPHLSMGEHSIIGWQALCYNQGPVVIGDHVVVSQRSFLCTGTHDVNDPNFQLVTQPIIIDTYAWVAADTFVGPGVHIHEGAVLGARGVTFKDLDAWTVYGGTPAKKISTRTPFSKPAI